MLLGILILIILLIVVPFFAGELLANNGESNLIRFVYGYFALWTVTFFLSVFATLTDRKLDFVVAGYLIISIPASIAGLILYIRRYRKGVLHTYDKLTANEFIFLAGFMGIVLFQIYKTIFYAYADGDDAFYIAASQDMNTTGLLYRTIPYIGTYLGVDKLNYRYALSPLPVWIAMLARISGLHVTVISYNIIAPLFMVLSYIIFNEIAICLYKDNREKRYMLLLLLAFFAMFANVSTQTAETFMLTRARQGKEALANIVIPFVFMLMARFSVKKGDEAEMRLELRDVILLLLAAVSAALMSVFGNILMLVMLFVLFCYTLFFWRKIKPAIIIAFLALPNIVIAGLYITLG